MRADRAEQGAPGDPPTSASRLKSVDLSIVVVAILC